MAQTEPEPGRGVVRPGIRLVDEATRDAFGQIGVASIHESQGRTGLLSPEIRPIFPGSRVAGTAVTVTVPPGDNWMIHVAVEQCGHGDILVVAPIEPSSAGYVGELLATSLASRGVRAVVIDAGCRDVAELQEMGFPVWSRHVSAQGTIKASLGTVNFPIVCAGQEVSPGDIVIGDDDGVVVVQADRANQVLIDAQERESREASLRERYHAGELSLDIYKMRDDLAALGIAYVGFEETGEPANDH